MGGLEDRLLILIKELEEEKRLADKRAKQLYDLAAGGAGDKISEGDSKVEVVDLGTGYIQTLADNQQVRKDQVLGNIQPLQPAFLVYLSAHINDVTGDTTKYTVVWNTEVFDQGGNFASNIFTAPVDGKYPLKFHTMLMDLDADTYELIRIQIVTSNRTYEEHWSGLYYNNNAWSSYLLSVIADMDANDTAYVTVTASGGAKSVDIAGGAILYTSFSGALLC